LRSAGSLDAATGPIVWTRLGMHGTIADWVPGQPGGSVSTAMMRSSLEG